MPPLMERRRENIEFDFIKNLLEKNSELLLGLTVSVAEVKVKMEQVEKHISDHAKAIHALQQRHTTGCPLLKEHDEEMEEKLKSLGDRLQVIEDKPKKRMEVVIAEGIKVIVGMIVGALIFKYGGK